MNQVPVGMLQLLDEESRVPGASNSTLLRKWSKYLKNGSHLSLTEQKHPLKFCVNHYAGKVCVPGERIYLVVQLRCVSASLSPFCLVKLV